MPPAVGQLADLALWEAELATDPVVAESALVSRLRQVPDQRAKRGRRHALVVVLVLTACATLVVDGDSMAAIRQWAARAPQAKLSRLGARRDPLTGRFLVPSERTFRRVLADLDAAALDAATCGYVADLARRTVPVPEIPPTPGPAEREQRRAIQREAEHPVPDGLLPAAALDGKALAGARTGSGRVFLVGAVALLDGTVAECDQLGDGTADYSGKKKRHGVNIQAVTSPDGTILWFSPALPGRTHDLAAAREHRIIATCEELDIAVLADKGYLGAGGTVETPFKPRPLCELPDKLRKFNKVHARLRVPVERAFARLKSSSPDGRRRSSRPARAGTSALVGVRAVVDLGRQVDET